MKTVKKIDVKSAARVYGYFLAIIGFLTALLMAVANSVNVIIYEEFTIVSVIMTTIFNLLVGCLVGLISAMAGMIIGYISGSILAWFYNLAVRTKFIGGIKIDLDPHP